MKTLILILAMTSVTLADITASVETVTIVVGATSSTQIEGALILHSKDCLRITTIGAVTFNTDKPFTLTAMSDEGKPVDVKKITGNSYLVYKAGKVRFNLTFIDFDTKSMTQEVVLLDLPIAGATDESHHDDNADIPAPDPPGLFDDLANRVRAHAQYISVQGRLKINSLVATAANKMRTLEFRDSKQAFDYIRKYWPPCENEHCNVIYVMATTELESQPRSWTDIQAYYNEIAKGVLQPCSPYAPITPH